MTLHSKIELNICRTKVRTLSFETTIHSIHNLWPDFKRFFTPTLLVWAVVLVCKFGRAPAFDTTGLQFESDHRPILYIQSIVLKGRKKRP